MSIKKTLNNTLESTITLGFWKGRERIKSVKFKSIVQIISLHKFQYPVHPSRIPKPYYIPIKFKLQHWLLLNTSTPPSSSILFQNKHFEGRKKMKLKKKIQIIELAYNRPCNHSYKSWIFLWIRYINKSDYRSCGSPEL